MAALGTENFGSINYPAQQNGIVGIKPTMGLVSRYGNIPTTHTLDIIGPMAGTVADAAIVLGIMAGRDEHDPATHAQQAGDRYDYTECLDKEGLCNARIGIEREKWTELKGERQQAFERLLATVQDAGAHIVEVQGVGEIISENDIDPVFFYECKSCMNAYLSTLRADLTCTSVQEIIDFNQHHAEQALKYGQPLLLHAQNKTSGRFIEPEYLEALVKRERAIHKLDAIFTQQQVDVLLCTQCEIVAPITGLPSMSLPIGTHENRIPIGSYWIARRYDEATLLRIAYAAEKMLGVHCAPEGLA
jgi:amidase